MSETKIVIPGSRMLLVCGICGKPNCYLSRWIDTPDQVIILLSNDDLDALISDIMDEYDSSLTSLLSQPIEALQSTISRIAPNAEIPAEDIMRALMAKSPALRDAIAESESQYAPIAKDDGFLQSLLESNALPADTMVVRNMNVPKH